MPEKSPIQCGWCRKEIKEGTVLEWCDHFGKVHGKCLDKLIGEIDYNYSIYLKQVC